MEKPNVNIYPWTGFNYEAGFMNKGKLMVLGESFYWGDYKNNPQNHYSYEEYKNDLSNAIISTVELYLNRRKPEDGETNGHWKKTCTILTKICLGKSKKEMLTKEEKDLFWDSILFYNYINEPLKTARQKIDETVWQKSQKDFYAVLNYYMPNYILILGDRLWNNTPREFWKIDQNDKNIGYYKIDNQIIYASSIYHTSSRNAYGTNDFNPYEVVNKLFEKRHSQ